MVRTIAFFNNKGGVGKTSLVYHLAWMYALQGLRVLAADLDPQANLTAALLDEDRIEKLWAGTELPDRHTVYGAVQPLLQGTGDIGSIHVEPITEKLALLPGDLALSAFEDELSAQWPLCLDGNTRAFRVLSAFWRILQLAANAHRADVVLIDVGPNLGAINRAALIAAEHVVVPLAPDLFSLQGLRNLGPTLQTWRQQWGQRLDSVRTMPPRALEGVDLPSGSMTPAGYIVLQHSVRLDRPVRAYEQWMARIPGTYRQYVVAEPAANLPPVTEDPNCLQLVKHYRSLMAMAQEARKPMFLLLPADGAIGAHAAAAQDARNCFEKLARRIAQRTGGWLP